MAVRTQLASEIDQLAASVGASLSDFRRVPHAILLIGIRPLRPRTCQIPSRSVPNLVLVTLLVRTQGRGAA